MGATATHPLRTRGSSEIALTTAGTGYAGLIGHNANNVSYFIPFNLLVLSNGSIQKQTYFQECSLSVFVCNVGTAT